MKGFVPVRRGLSDHLPSMTGDQVKLYLGLLLSARNSGSERGQVAASVRDLAALVGWSKSKAHRTLQSLAPKYVEIEPAANQHEPTIVHIQRFSLSQIDGTAKPKSGTADPFSLSQIDGTAKPKSGTADPKSGTATPVTDTKQKNLLAPDRKDRKDRDIEPSLRSGSSRTPARGLPDPPRIAYDEFGYIRLSEQEHERLVERFGIERTAELIEEVGCWIAQAPDSTDSRRTKRREQAPYPTILNWARRDEKRRTEGVKNGSTSQSKPDAARRQGYEAILRVAGSDPEVAARLRGGFSEPRRIDDGGASPRLPDAPGRSDT